MYLNKKFLALILLMLLQMPLAYAACSISAKNVAFGTYNPFNTNPTTSKGDISVVCGLQESFTISLSKGMGNTFNPRSMYSGAYSLNYNLYLDASYTTIWGDGSSGTGQIKRGPILPVCTTMLPCSFTLYGSIPASQTDVAAGMYTDQITVTIKF